MPTLGELLRGVDVVSFEPPDAMSVSIAEVRDDSRSVRPGDLFVAVKGQTVDGNAYVGRASEQGAVAVVSTEPRVSFAGARVLVASDTRALGQIAANRHGRPGDAMRLIGITGTNGKTTGTYLVERMLAEAGRVPGVIGTVGYRTPRGSRPAPFTTPLPLALHGLLAEMRDQGCTDVVMECSSHALALDRLEGLSFSVAAFGNLTQDHLDFHQTMDAYSRAKQRLFSERLRRDGVAVVCIDGPHGEEMAAASVAPVLRVATRGERGDVRVVRAERDARGTAVEMVTPAGALSFVSPLFGGFNLENLAVSVGLGLALGLALGQIGDGLAGATGAPGRLERVGVDALPGIVAYVDYAHTPDALERVLAALRPVTEGRLWVVFGCGGDRDRGKRAIMGRIAATGADLVVVTSDNPRSEHPETILDDILAGTEPGLRVDEAHMGAASIGLTVVPDRREAIALAVGLAHAGDVILVAGKGHEDYQIVGTERLHFDDREEVRDALQRRARAEGAETSAAT